MLRRLVVGLGFVVLACGGRTGSDLPDGGGGSFPTTGGTAGGGGAGAIGASPGGGYPAFGGAYPIGGAAGYAAYPGYGGVAGYPGYGGSYPTGGAAGYGAYPGYGGYNATGGVGGFYPGGSGGFAGTGGQSGCYYNGAYYAPGSYVNPCCVCVVAGAPIQCFEDCGVGGAAGVGGGTSMCPFAPPELFSPLIDDFEDGNYLPYHPVGFTSWYPYQDGTGVQSWELARPGLDGLFALRTYGYGNTLWGAGTGVSLRGLSESCPFPADQFAGITFLASGQMLPLRVSVITRDTLPVEEGGFCSVRELCYDHYGADIVVGPSQRFSFRFAEMRQQGWGIPVPFDRTQVMGIQFQAGAFTTYDFTIDDLAFLVPID